MEGTVSVFHSTLIKHHLTYNTDYNLLQEYACIWHHQYRSSIIYKMTALFKEYFKYSEMYIWYVFKTLLGRCLNANEGL